MAGIQGGAMALHGGAIIDTAKDYSLEIEHMRELVEVARTRLDQGEAAASIAAAIVHEMEMSGLYVAGRGASPNDEGLYELDAALMDGTTARIGAVAALQNFKSPVEVARAVMESSPHVFFAGAGAAAFARRSGLEPVPDDNWYTHVGSGRSASGFGSRPFGTVGCVVLDRYGGLASATSTAGIFGKQAGRVGDSPVPGAGTWADRFCAVSCTGHGEFFIRTAAAVQVAHRLHYAGQGLNDAAVAVLREVEDLGGSGGLIAIDVAGRIAMPFISAGMKRAALFSDGSVSVNVR
ncbi:MAG TPA: isoaspartyl peptidase/L-asparaginase [Parvibaculum sp.]|nr:isoaspartyl peptidase/L-asparaginase [Parvibaculum sp.]